MVATIKVIQGGAKAISKYYGLMDGAIEYYVEQSFSQWFGNAARLLGLQGTIDRRDFQNVLTGRSPSGQPLGRIRPDAPNAKRQRVPGYDVTFSVPKSVSVLWAIGDIQTQQLIREAVLKAVHSALSELESDLPLARRGRGGKSEIPADLIVGMFLHELSRANDPNLHVHCIVANACFGTDKQWSAVNSRKLHEWTMTLGGIFRSHLCRELQQRLNVTFRDGIGRDGSIGDWKEVAEIPKSLIDHLSKRSAQIEHSVDDSRLGDSHARQRANFATRASKNEPHDHEALRNQWRTEARSHGIDWEELSGRVADQTANPHIVALPEELRHLIENATIIETELDGRMVLPTPEVEIEPASIPDEPENDRDVQNHFLNEDSGKEVETPSEATMQEEPRNASRVAAAIDPIAELFGDSTEQQPECDFTEANVEETQQSEQQLPRPQKPDSVTFEETTTSTKQRPESSVESETKSASQHRPQVAIPLRPEQPRAVEDVSTPPSRFPRELTPKEEALYDRRFSETVERLAEQRAYYSASQFTTALGTQLRKDSIAVPNLIDRVRNDLENREEVVVLPHTQRPLYSSRTYFEKEQSLVDDAKALQESRGIRVDLRTAEKYSHQRDDLNPEQARAAFHLLTQSSGLKMITTASGSGHEKTLIAVSEAFSKAGHQVVGTALSGRTSSAFEKSTGIQTRTLASWLYHLDRSELQKFSDAARHEAKMFGRAIVGKSRWERTDVRLPKGGVIVVEQAGMIDTHGMSRLLHHARLAECTVVLAGDSAQLQPIGVGGPLEYLQRLSGTAELKEHHRQESETDRVAVDNLRNQRPEDALQKYEDRGRFRVSEHPEKTLVEEWAQSNAVRQPQNHMILTPTRKLRDEANSLCQQERLVRQLISGPGIRHGDQRYYTGDRIRFMSPQRRKGIDTGACGTVTGINPITRSINVRLDNPPSNEEQKRFGARQTATISLLDTDESAIQLGYAATTHQVHGGECDHVWVLVDGGHTTSELAYSQISHGKESTRLFAQQRSDGSERARVADDWSVSQKKDLAHDQMNHIDLNLEH